jgi:uncharacterized protein
MIGPATIYRGDVVHKRLRPVPHALTYHVFSLLLDVDRIDEVARTHRWFSRNKFNLLSFYDRDHGPRCDTAIGDHARTLLQQHGFATANVRILLLSYPRVFGYVFNPLSVYYVFDAGDALVALIYEVNNTFGERKSHVVAAGDGDVGVYAQTGRKQLFVSPFASGEGSYGFRVRAPAENEALVLGVNYRDSEGPLIKTHFRANGVPMTDSHVLVAVAAMPLMTVKVMAAIHWEAAKIWWKGVPLARRHRSPKFSVASADDAAPASTTPSPPRATT